MDARKGPRRPRDVTFRMSCSCLSTACTSSCSSQRNSSSWRDRPRSAARARRPHPAPPDRPCASPAPPAPPPSVPSRSPSPLLSVKLLSPVSGLRPPPLGQYSAPGPSPRRRLAKWEPVRPRTTAPFRRLAERTPAPPPARHRAEWNCAGCSKNPPAPARPRRRRRKPRAPHPSQLFSWSALVPPLPGSDRVPLPTCALLAGGMAGSRRAWRLADGAAAPAASPSTLVRGSRLRKKPRA